MQRSKLVRLLALLAAFALFAAACGSGSDSEGSSGSDTETTDEDDAGTDAEDDAETAEETDADMADEGDEAREEEDASDDKGALVEEDDAADEGDEAREEEDASDDKGAMVEEDDAADEGDEDMEEGDGGDDGAAAPSGEAGSSGELTILQWQAPSQANSLLSSGTKDILAGSLVLEPLARFGPDGKMVPALAAEIPTLENGGIGFAKDSSSITWTLRDDVLWSDGTPFTADDVVFTFEYCSDELTGCTADFTTVADVNADDDHTVTITFTDPQPYPYNDFVGYAEVILQRAQMEPCIGEGASACSEQNFAPVGTGPYMVTELKPEDTVTYEMNPNYRGIAEGKPSFSNITIKGGGDAESAARSVLELGEADFAWNLQVAPEIIEPMAAAGAGRLVTAFSTGVEAIYLNQTDPNADRPSEYVEDGSGNHPILFNNGEFAKALSLAINRDALVAVGYGSAGRPTCTVWPLESQASTNNDWCLTQDLDQANRILDGLGYADSDGDGVREFADGTPLEFDFVTSTNAVRQSNQDLIKADWEKIGIKANMSNQDASLFFDGTSASDASIWKFFSDMEMFTNTSNTPDPSGSMGQYIIDEIPTAADGWPSSGNIPRMQSPEFDEAWAKLSQTALNDPTYIEQVKGLQDLIIESGSMIPLVYRGSFSGIASDIEGLGDLNGWDSEYWNIQDWYRTE